MLKYTLHFECKYRVHSRQRLSERNASTRQHQPIIGQIYLRFAEGSLIHLSLIMAYSSGAKLGPQGPKVSPGDLKIGPHRILGLDFDLRRINSVQK